MSRKPAGKRNFTVFAALWGAAWLTACPETESPEEVSGCRRDTDCKGERICEAGACVAPRPGVAANSPAVAVAPVTGGWRRGGPGRPDQALGTGPEGQPQIVWDVDLGAVVFGSPTLATVGGELVALVGTHAGRFVGVAVEGARAGQVVLDLSLGGMVWATAAAADGRAYVGADDDTLYAIDLAARTVAWTLKVGNCGETRAPGPEGARCDADGGPTIAADGDLYLGADGVYRIGRDGKIRWHYPAEATLKAKHVFAAPLVAGDGNVYVGSQDGLILSLRSADGTLRWIHRSTTQGWTVAGPAVAPSGDVVAPLRELLPPGPRQSFVMGRVSSIDVQRRQLECQTLGGSRTIAYDHLVLAIGNRARLDLMPGMAEHGLPLKTVGDAVEIRNVVLRRLARIRASAAPGTRCPRRAGC